LILCAFSKYTKARNALIASKARAINAKHRLAEGGLIVRVRVNVTIEMLFRAVMKLIVDRTSVEVSKCYNTSRVASILIAHISCL
jgi:hypothetical protein